jgi:tyrosinase
MKAQLTFLTPPRNALNGPFTIYFFLCPRSHFPSDTHPSDYALSPYLAGINHIFASPREVCDNCGAQDVTGSLASDTVPISPLLLDYMNKGQLQSMRAEHVRPFLVDYLRWRVVHVSLLLLREALEQRFQSPAWCLEGCG